jgi:predicted MPP superfamily phosphohydrolase
MFLGSPELERLVQLVNALEGDAVLITGDVFHSPLTRVELATPILKKLKPRRLGNFAVLGNHDFYTGESLAAQSLKDSGLTLLRHQWISFREGSANIHLGGIDDPMVNWVWGSQFPKFEGFMAKAPTTPGMRILLSHRPSVLPIASQAGIDFVLSGHIHGGQIIFPYPGRDRGLSIARVASPFTHGWYRIGKSRMYLNRGIGLTFAPWRINCPAEITLFHLPRRQ